MRYLRPLLCDRETVLYDGRIHPIVFLKGSLYLFGAWFCLDILADLPAKGGPLLWLAYQIQNGFFAPVASALWELHHWLRAHSSVPTAAGWIFVIMAIAALTRGAIDYFFTELAVTDLRLLVKRGVYNVVTAEIDADRIAGVTVYQPFTGRILNYGWVLIHGFTHNVSGLPPLTDPYKLQQQLGNSAHSTL